MLEQPSSILATDLAGPVFKLLFCFGRDEAYDEAEDFQSELYEIFPDTNLPDLVKTRLESIFHESRFSKNSLIELAEEVKVVAAGNRQAIVSIAELLLSQVVIDGILCRKASSKFEQIAEVFSLTDEEIQGLPESLRNVLSLIYDINNQHRDKQSQPKETKALYQMLECAPDCSDNELRSSYRKLVKKLHPDSAGQSRGKARRFLEVQDAFEKIIQIRAKV